jgi:hypothetical protein
VASFGATPITYGEGLVDRVRTLTPAVDAVFDAAGRGVLPDSIELRGGTDRILTIADPAAAELGVELSEEAKPSRTGLAELLGLVARGEVSVPVARVLPFAAAAGLVKGVVAVILVLVANKVAHLFGEAGVYQKA